MGYGHHHEHGHGHGYGRRAFWGRGGCEPGYGFGFRPNREEWLKRLEEYQKDLEQRTADVADLIRRLREEAPQATESGTVTTA